MVLFVKLKLTKQIVITDSFKIPKNVLTLKVSPARFNISGLICYLVSLLTSSLFS